MYFEELNVCMTVEIPPALIEKEKMMDFARTYDNIPLHTDENYALPFGKVRRRGTLFVEAKCARLPENGIYIDIYPLDFAPAEEGERKLLAKKLEKSFLWQFSVVLRTM